MRMRPFARYLLILYPVGYAHNQATFCPVALWDLCPKR